MAGRICYRLNLRTAAPLAKQWRSFHAASRKMSVPALPMNKIGRMKPVQLMSALYHERKAKGKHKKNEADAGAPTSFC
jgi:hypothetical protein